MYSHKTTNVSRILHKFRKWRVGSHSQLLHTVANLIFFHSAKSHMVIQELCNIEDLSRLLDVGYVSKNPQIPSIDQKFQRRGASFNGKYPQSEKRVDSFFGHSNPYGCFCGMK